LRIFNALEDARIGASHHAGQVCLVLSMNVVTRKFLKAFVETKRPIGSFRPLLRLAKPATLSQHGSRLEPQLLVELDTAARIVLPKQSSLARDSVISGSRLKL
jgi:hypothetical protein